MAPWLRHNNNNSVERCVVLTGGWQQDVTRNTNTTHVLSPLTWQTPDNTDGIISLAPWMFMSAMSDLSAGESQSSHSLQPSLRIS